MTNNDIFPMLISGGCGRLARRLVPALLGQGVAPTDLIVTSRTPEQLQHLAHKGVRVRQANFKQVEGLSEAFAGARRALIISTMASRPGARVPEHLAAVDAAARADVEHIFYTSAPNPEPGSPTI